MTELLKLAELIGRPVARAWCFVTGRPKWWCATLLFMLSTVVYLRHAVELGDLTLVVINSLILAVQVWVASAASTWSTRGMVRRSPVSVGMFVLTVGLAVSMAISGPGLLIIGSSLSAVGWAVHLVDEPEGDTLSQWIRDRRRSTSPAGARA